MQCLLLTDRSHPARHALSARLVSEERGDPKHDVREVHGVVEQHDDAGTERRAGGLRVLEGAPQPEVSGTDERPRRAAEEHGLQLPAAANAAREVDEVAESGAVLDLVQTRRLDTTRQAEQARSRRVGRAELGVLEPSHGQDLEDVDERLDVVDPGRLAEQAHLHGERRLVPRLPALPLDRVEQRRLLAADVGAGAAAQLHVETEPLAHDVLAEESARVRLLDRPLEAVSREPVLPPHIDEALLRSGRVSRDGERLEHRERIALHQHTVLEGARFGLVRVAYEVVRPNGLLRDGIPLHAGREGRAAASDEVRVLQFLDNALGTELDSPAERLVATQCAIVADRSGIDDSDTTKQTPFAHVLRNRVFVMSPDTPPSSLDERSEGFHRRARDLRL